VLRSPRAVRHGAQRGRLHHVASAAFHLAAALAAATAAASFAIAAALTFTAASLAAAGRLHEHRRV
jgi:hypothetical protein